MSTWMSALANGILFTIPIWLGHFYDSLPWFYWPAVGIAGILVMWITAAKEAKTDRQARQQASFRQFNVEKLTQLQEAVGRIESRENREAVIRALGDYYEEIINTVGEHQVASPTKAILTYGYGSTRGSVRDIIPPPQFDK